MASVQTTTLPSLGIGAPGVSWTLHDDTQFTPDSNTLSAAAVIVSNKGPLYPVYCTSVQQVRSLFGPVAANEGLSKVALNSGVQGMPHWVLRVADTNTAATGAIGFNFKTQKFSAGLSLGDATTLENNDLVFAALNPGDWINGYSVSLTNFKPATKTFDVVIYPPVTNGSSLATPVETFTVTLNNSVNGFYQQQEITSTINDGTQGTSSNYITVIKGNALSNTDAFFASLASTQQATPGANYNFSATFNNGANGNWPSDAQIANAVSTFADKQKYDFWVLPTYGFTSPTVISAVNDVVTSRPDCVGLVDVPSSAQDTSGSGVQEAEWMNGSGITSSRMFTFTNDVYQAVQDLGLSTYTPPTGSVVKQFGLSWRDNGVFLAVAGRKRGALSDVLKTRVTYNDDGLTLLSNSRINPIVQNPNGGYMIGDCITGQTFTSMLSYMEVVVGLIYIRRLVLNIAGNYEFDNITQTEMYYIQRQIMQPLQNLVNNSSIQGAQVICDSTNNPPEVSITGTLNISIYLAFFGVARQIKVDAYLTKDSASFASLQAGVS